MAAFFFEMENKNCVIGLDCGGTHTEGYLYDDKGNSLQKISGNSGNVLVDYRNSVKNINSVVSKLIGLADANELEVKFIMLGIAGLSFIDDKERLARDIGIDSYNCKLVNDAELGLFSEFGDDDGCIVIAGTGSTILSKKDDQIFRVGGWGHMLGDEGGAYFIGKQAFKVALDEYDKGVNGIFKNNLLDYLKIENIFELVNYFYKANKKEIALIAEFVFRQADKENNITAQKIINIAAEELTKQIRISLEKSRLDETQHVKVAFSGTPIEKNENYRNLIIKKLDMRNISFSLKKSENNAVAAYKYYFGMERKNGK
ncbi:N-acetylglucosamine kinase [Companilactobacillus sp. RD055328]|uniref:BadF/BadG/BcrA/BcrD ATPase family protein n=1 Tax=Companilactobacillus sp. RD055328 TaxID=2916634 RepID=UPI001FC8E97E|nr:BadF/BadG/BcrA/BcrD ATPase family protein [Companilactobacillus sp. RD055328]GKQ43448.1 N-acetylglucosamine kinase [Companilactobacillus sp. RD055328]